MCTQESPRQDIISITADLTYTTENGMIKMSGETYFFDTPDGEERANITSNADEFDPNVGALFDHLIFVVGVLRRSGIGIKSDLRRDKLSPPILIIES